MLHRLDILGGKQAILMLVPHVLYLNIVQRTPLLRSIQRITGVLGMDMYLYNILHHSNDHRITKAL